MVRVSEARSLRILIANERRDRLALLADVVGSLGHVVVGIEIDVKKVGATTTQEHPDVALVGLGESSVHALGLIEQIGRESSCPVIALLSAEDPVFIRDAANRGVFAYIVDTGPEELQSAIDITLLRFAEYHDLRDAFERRSVIEQAKGILMARHAISAEKAFGMLREHSQRTGVKIIGVAAAVVSSHMLLVPPPDPR
jgi:AmiR/NasT family two-component response regulator